MADNEVVFVGDSSSLEKAQERIVAGNDKISKSTEGTVKTSRQAAAEERKRLAEAAKLIRDNETAQERANRKIKEAEDLYRQEKISLEVLNREITKQQAVIAAVTQKERENTAEYKARKAAIEEAIAAKAREDEAAKAAAEEQKKRDKEALARIEELRKAEEERLRRLDTDLKKVQSPAQKYVEKLKEWKTALQQGNITQEQFNRLKDAELKKLNDSASSTKKLTVATEDLSSETKKLGDVSEATLDGMVQKGAAVLAGLFSIHKMISAIVAEYEKWLALQGKARDASASFQETMEDLRMNFDPDESLGWEGLDAAVREIAEKSGVSVKDAASVLGGAFSAKGDRTNQWAVQASIDSLSLVKNVQQASVLASATGDIAKFGESQDPKAIQGFLKQAQLASRIESVEGTGGQAISPLSAGKELGMSLERGMEYFAAIGNIMGDKTGQTSSSAVVNFFNNLGDKFHLTSEQKKNKELKAQFDQFHAMPKDESRIGFLQAPEHELLREAFILNNPGEAKAGPAIRSLLRNDEKWQTEIRKVEEQVPSLHPSNDATNRDFFLQNRRQVQGEGTAAGSIATADQKAKTNVEQYHLEMGPIKGRLAQMRSIAADTLKNVDLKGIDWTAEQGMWFNNMVGEMVGSQNPEDVIFDSFKWSRELLKPDDKAAHEFFDKQMKEMEELKQQIDLERSKNGSPPTKFRIGPDETLSRPGFEDLPPVNERGSYEGTVRDMGVSSTMDPRGLETALTAAMTKAMEPMLQELRQLRSQSASDHQKDLQAMQQQTAAIQSNRPAKMSPLSLQDRRFRGNV